MTELSPEINAKIEKDNKEMTDTILNMFDLKNKDKRILTKSELESLIPMIKMIMVLNIQTSLTLHLKEKMKEDKK